MKSFLNITTNNCKNFRISFLSCKNVTINELKQRKLDIMKSTANFTENPTLDE